MSQIEVGRPLYVTKENHWVASELLWSTIQSYQAEMAFFLLRTLHVICPIHHYRAAVPTLTNIS